MSKDGNVSIIVKVSGDMPRLTDPRILDASYLNGTATSRPARTYGTAFLRSSTGRTTEYGR